MSQPANQPTCTPLSVRHSSHTLQVGRFKSSFVNSGTTGSDIGAAPTVVPPRQRPPGVAGGAAEAVGDAPLSRFGFATSGGGDGSGAGDGGGGATVALRAPAAAPTTASGRPVPPPPVPVTERPMYLQQRNFQAGRRATGGGPQAGPNLLHSAGNPGAFGGGPLAGGDGGGGGGGAYNRLAPPPSLYATQLSAGGGAAYYPGGALSEAAVAAAQAQA
eukprot:364294-Chlamydomonas_euryale.AAC.1